MPAVANIKAIILTGGKSSRMGEDKGRIAYHGQSQVDFLYTELSSLLIETFVSCRNDQAGQYKNYRVITDKFGEAGPAGGILSAFCHDDKAAWLVLACDMPLIDRSSIAFLLSKRNPDSIATVFLNGKTGKPDPLFALWEPSSCPILRQNLEKGLLSPVSILSENPTEQILHYDENWLKNLNTPEEKEKFIRQMKLHEHPSGSQERNA